MTRTIEADLSYYRPQGAEPRGKPNFARLPLASEHARIADARGRESEFSLDKQGFALVRWPSKVKDFRNADEAARVYVAEVDEMLRHLTGCAKVVTAGSGYIRISDRVGKRPDNTSPTGNFVHSDYSRNSGPFWVRHSLPEAEAQERLKRRVSIFNVWRTYSGGAQDVPLALCDARSVAPQDVVHTDFTVGTSKGESVSFENATYRYNKDHDWFYFSNMAPDETLIFRGYESDPARAEPVPHTAFQDLTCPTDAPPRESIEIRSIVFYDD